MKPQLSIKQISQKIFFIRGCRVMLDSDLALLYEVTTGALKRSVRRNQKRFPEDFAFQLTEIEKESLRCQFGISKIEGRGGRRDLPIVFTEQGVAMLSSVLRSEKAVLVNIEIMRSFVQLREFLLSNKELAQKLERLEKKYDAQLKAVFDAIKSMMNPPIPPKNRIGI